MKRKHPRRRRPKKRRKLLNMDPLTRKRFLEWDSKNRYDCNNH